MNLSLTWANYAFIITLCLTVYYIVIGVVYYKKNLLHFTRSKKEPAGYNRDQQSLSTVVTKQPPSSIPYNDLLDNTKSVETELLNQQLTTEDFMDEIYAYTQACGTNVSKEILGINLRRILQKYPSLINSSLWSVLSGVIATASENNCSIQWSEDELNELRNS